MTKIKMSEVFESKLTGQRLFKALDDCITASVKWLNQYTYAATAINAYDANQQEIVELKAKLQSVKADAVKAFGHEIGLYDSEYDDQEYIEVSRYSLREHIEQLREGKS